MTLPTKFRRLKLWIIIIPLILIALGNVCNQAVIVANHGKFPVEVTRVATVTKAHPNGLAPGDMMDDEHVVMSDSDNLKFLSDLFSMEGAIFSIGDGLLFLGYWLWSFAPFIWIFTLCSLVLKGKDESLKPAPIRYGTQALAGQFSCQGADALRESFNRTAMQSLRRFDTKMRVC